MIDYVVVVVVAADVDVDVDDGDDNDDDVDDEVMQNHFRHKECHQRRSSIVVRMDRMVQLERPIRVVHCNVVYNTYHRNHHPRRSSPFDVLVVETNLEKKTANRQVVATLFS